MLITHVKPGELWGKRVFDTNGRLLGEVIAIGSRRGAVRRVVVQKTATSRPVRMKPPAGASIEADIVLFPAVVPPRPRLRIVR
jgi:sporulation protein YlmC with PRC-barrel domain